MAEMLIRTVDKDACGDPEIDYQRTKRGDVICVQDDGWPWSASECCPPWVIVRVPGTSTETLAAFVAETPGGPPEVVLRHRRAFSFDLDAWEADGSQELSETEALGRKVTKPEPADPDVIG